MCVLHTTLRQSLHVSEGRAIIDSVFLKFKNWPVVAHASCSQCCVAAMAVVLAQSLLPSTETEMWVVGTVVDKKIEIQE